MLFSIDEPDGISGADGSRPPATMLAVAMANSAVLLFDAALKRDIVGIAEHPVSRRSGPWAIKGREKHATLFDYGPMAKLVQATCEAGGAMVYADQSAAGAKTQKTTAFLVTPRARAAAEQRLGTLRSPPGAVASTSLQGRTPAGGFASAQSEVYPPELCAILAMILA